MAKKKTSTQRVIKGRDYRTSKNRDGLRKAKKIGYRFSGDSMRTPTSSEVQQMHDEKRDDIYYENRVERSDKSPRAKRGHRFAKGGGFDVKVNKIKKLLKKNNVKSDEVSPNFVNDFAHKNGVTDLTSEQVVRISDTYAKGGSVKQTKAGIKQDKNVKAKKAGKRTSEDGNVYYENRPNRSDKNRTKKLAKGGGVKQSKAGIAQDKNIKALKAGKRESADGNIYYENRPNRSDVNRTKKLGKGGDFFTKLKSGTKEAYDKSKKYTKDKIHDQKKKVALEVIDDTKDKVTSSKTKIVLKGAEEIVKDKYEGGGSVGSEEKAVRGILNSKGEISCDELGSIIGRSPCYPVCKVGGMTLRKKFMCGYKEI